MDRMGPVVLVAALVLSACGGGGAPPEGEQGGPAQPPEEAPAETVPTATCEDEAGDAAARVSAVDFSGESQEHEGEIPEHVDLRRVDLSVSDDTVTATFEVAGPLPSGTGDGSPLPLASVNVGVLIDGRLRYALAVSETGEAGSIEFGEDGGGEESGAGTVEMEGNRATLSIPLAEVAEMDGEFHWYGSATAREDKAFEEEQIRASDTCPSLSEEEIALANVVDQQAPAEILEKLPTQP